uniref:SPK domain-containing protein n=1 Tax=Caenorhabditis tropicalis TaxID=1561998 RepID=A0A1I7UWD1_9PELO
MSSQSLIDRYGLDMTLSDVEYSDNEEDQEVKIRPQKLLDMAVDKRFKLFKKDGNNMRCEVLQTRLIVKLYRHIEEEKRMERKRKESTNCVFQAPIVNESKKFKAGEE